MNEFVAGYTLAAKAGFFTYLCFQLAVLLYFRRKLIAIMREDVF
jgi:hypothetical protein